MDACCDWCCPWLCPRRYQPLSQQEVRPHESFSDWRDQLRAVLGQSLAELSVHSDFPRIAANISVGAAAPPGPTERPKSALELAQARQVHAKAALLGLCDIVGARELRGRLDATWLEVIPRDALDVGPGMRELFDRCGVEGSPVGLVLKSITQAVMFAPFQRVKWIMSAAHDGDYRDADTWRVAVRQEAGRVLVVHTKSTVAQPPADAGRFDRYVRPGFELLWTLTFAFPSPPNGIPGIELEVTSLRFTPKPFFAGREWRDRRDAIEGACRDEWPHVRVGTLPSKPKPSPGI